MRYLVAHVVGGNRFASMILGGDTAAEAMESVMGSAQLGTDACSVTTTTASRTSEVGSVQAAHF